MGYIVSLGGTLSVPAATEAASITRLVAAETFSELVEVDDTKANLAEVLHSFGWEVYEVKTETADGVKVTVCGFSYGDNWYDSVVSELAALAGEGVVGSIFLTGEDDNQWKIILDAGTLTQVDAELYYPKDPSLTEGTILLSRSDARVVLSLLAGDHVAGLDDVVKKLTVALG